MRIDASNAKGLLRCAAAFLMAILPVVTLAQSPVKKQREFITLKVINGKTGRSVWNTIPYVFIGEKLNGCRISIATRKSGIERTCLGRHVAPPLQFTFDGTTIQQENSYSIAQIKKAGIVTANYCGTAQAQPHPGILLIYVIQETFKQL